MLPVEWFAVAVELPLPSTSSGEQGRIIEGMQKEVRRGLLLHPQGAGLPPPEPARRFTRVRTSVGRDTSTMGQHAGRRAGIRCWGITWVFPCRLHVKTPQRRQ